MSFNLILNNTNIISSSNTVFQYKFIQGNFKIPENSEICISTLSIPYAWFNITEANNNNAFNIIDWNNNTINFVLPNGFYQQSDVQNYIQQYCLNNNLYLIDANGDYVFFLVISVNTSYYANQLLTFVVPTAVQFQPTVVGNPYYGWSAPSGFVFPTVATAPSLQILNNNFTQYIGFNVGTYGGGTSTTSTLSTFAPNTTPVNSLTMSINIVSNPCAIPTNIIDNIPITSTFGSNIVYEPKFQKWIAIAAGSYSNLIITILDQNFNPIVSNDPNTTISLLLKISK
jgi:hypothetical protein